MNEWTWAYDGGAQTSSAGFPTQAEAEAWLAEHWQELADAGVTAVTLRQAEVDVYGPMSLADS
ncbi:hypothetical protein IEE94_03725 [Yimella sp. cx-573]|nr:hypothetical protein [Yimella sp. cx-573]